VYVVTAEWRFKQAQGRLLEIERAVVGYGQEFNLPVRRIDAPPVATWTLDGRSIARFTRASAGPDLLEVDELGLLTALRKLRVRHVTLTSGDLRT
jgi:hypothetical protein